jgi:hypothetical protein
VPECFEAFKASFKSTKLRNLCSLRRITIEGDVDMEEYEWKLLETKDGLIDNYLPLLEPFKN